MGKLTKSQTRQHEQACALLEKDELTFDERWFVLENWHEGANHLNTAAGAFFTPVDLACDFKLEIRGSKVIDLCAGIGVLSFMHYHRQSHDRRPEITCIDINQAYVEVGKKVLPEATWICGDVFEVCRDLGGFDVAIANPPFGRGVKGPAAPRYRGPEFEFKVIDLASDLATFGAFIVPQKSAGFVFSGAPYYERREREEYRRFARQTGLHLEAGCGIDTTVHQDGWRGVSPRCEVVCCEFPDRDRAPELAASPTTFPAPTAEQMSLL